MTFLSAFFLNTRATLHSATRDTAPLSSSASNEPVRRDFRESASYEEKTSSVTESSLKTLTEASLDLARDALFTPEVFTADDFTAAPPARPAGYPNAADPTASSSSKKATLRRRTRRRRRRARVAASREQTVAGGTQRLEARAGAACPSPWKTRTRRIRRPYTLTLNRSRTTPSSLPSPWRRLARLRRARRWHARLGGAPPRDRERQFQLGGGFIGVRAGRPQSPAPSATSAASSADSDSSFASFRLVDCSFASARARARLHFGERVFERIHRGRA